MRTFIAIPITEEVHKKLWDLENQLKPVAGNSIRWVNPEIIHLTLKFLGEVKPQRIDLVSKAIHEISKEFACFSFEVKEMGVFPAWNRPRVFWAGLSAPRILFDLQKQVDKTTAELGIPSEGRPFNPHLTLGRVNEPLNPQLVAALKERMGSYQENSFGIVPVDQVVLYQSILQPGGPVYKPLSIHKLTGKV